MAIHQWPSAEQPRTKLLEKGPESLSDAELLAIFLRTGIAGKNAVELSRDLLHTFGSLRGLIKAQASEVCAVMGMGLAKYAHLRAAAELGRRILKEKLVRGAALCNPEDAGTFLRAQLQDRDREYFAALFLDNANQVIQYEELFVGTVNQCAVYPRHVVKAALAYNASAVIIAHNHPSGNPQPSHADYSLTKQLQEALRHLDIHLLDHMVVGINQCYSMAAAGEL